MVHQHTHTADRDGKARTARLVGRQALRRITTDLRCHDCGRATINPGGAVGVRRTDTVVGFAGLATCGRIWLCPVCNSKVMARRAIEVGAAIAWAQREGLQLLWGSLTLRHNPRSDLATLLEIQRNAWRRVVQSRLWKDWASTSTTPHECTDRCEPGCDRLVDVERSADRRYPHRHDGCSTKGRARCRKRWDVEHIQRPAGRVGQIRALELTIGSNGWHPHYHPMIFWEGPGAEEFATALVAEWCAAVQAEGGEAIADGGQQIRVLSGKVAFSELGAYVTKQTYDAAALALEVTWSQNKTGQTSKGRAAKTQAHWSLLATIAEGVSTHIDEVDRWQQLEEAIPGSRMLTWSRGLRSFAGIGVEQDDEEIAAEEVGTTEDTVCFITPEGWWSIRDQPEILGEILATTQKDGLAGLRPLLDVLGVDYFTLEQAAA